MPLLEARERVLQWVASRGIVFQCGGHHGFHPLVADGARGAAAGLVQQAGQAAIDKAGPPFAHGVVREPQLRGDLSAGVACRAAQDNLGALGQAMARLATMGPSQQFGPILGGDDQLRVVGTAAWHDVNFSERPVSSHDTISRISVSGH